MKIKNIQVSTIVALWLSATLEFHIFKFQEDKTKYIKVKTSNMQVSTIVAFGLWAALEFHKYKFSAD